MCGLPSLTSLALSFLSCPHQPGDSASLCLSFCTYKMGVDGTYHIGWSRRLSKFVGCLKLVQCEAVDLKKKSVISPAKRWGGVGFIWERQKISSWDKWSYGKNHRLVLNKGEERYFIEKGGKLGGVVWTEKSRRRGC